MSLTRPLTRPLTRKISRAELTQGYGGSFSPLLLNPYLLFDARESMVGTLENPTLDLNPALPETLDVITATRSGTATYTDANGVIQTASPDTVRVDHVDSVPMILVEPSATNLVTYSEDFSQSSWIKTGIGTGVAPVVTLNAAESPDGTQNATKVVFDSGSGITTSDQSLLEDFFNPTSGTSYTQSIYLKGENGGEKILLRNAGNNAYTTITLTTEWARYEVTETANGSTAYFSFGLRQGLGGVVINSKITVYAYGAQVEAGSLTSYIPTSGSTVTRAADNLVIDGSAFSDFYNQTEGTIYVEYEPKVVNSTSNTLFEFSNGTTAERILSLVEPFYNLYLTTSSVVEAQFGGGSPQADTLNRLAASFKPNNARLSLNGGTQVVDTSLSMPSLNQLNIGQRYNSVQHLNGHIKRLIYWPYHSDSL